MSTTAAARTAWHHAAQLWPKDPFRPKHLFSDAIRAASDRQLAPSATLSPEQLRKATDAAAALTRLVENRALKAVRPPSPPSPPPPPLIIELTFRPLSIPPLAPRSTPPGRHSTR